MSLNSLTIDVYNSRKHLLEILETQNYNVEEYTNLSMSEVHAMIQTKQLDLLINNKSTEKKLYIKYHLAKSLRVTNIQDYIEDLFNLENILTNNDDLIIITKEDPNDTLNKFLINIWEHNNIYIRVINIKRLQFNILKHDLVPDHSIMTNEEIEEFKSKYFIKEINKDNLPNISRFDPVALVIGLRPKQLCKITRNSRTAINATYYRICI